MRIIGPPTANRDELYSRLPDMASAQFRTEMFAPMWSEALSYGIDPVGVIAQSLKETGNGTFRGNVPPWFYNTCGLKVRNPERVVVILAALGATVTTEHTLCHAQFANWENGAAAHVQHLCAYAGIPVSYEVVDPRYVHVAGRNRLENWSDLGKRWAPSNTYGDEIETIMDRLQGSGR